MGVKNDPKAKWREFIIVLTWNYDYNNTHWPFCRCLITNKGTSDKDIRNDFMILYVCDPILLNRGYNYDLRKPITVLSLLLIFLSWPLCEERGGCQNHPSVYADVVGNPWEDSHIKVKGMLVRKLKLNP